jgi:3-hydroxymyristoyl/3-hydroxydecanoyl-(acyl carrier protein) dehydratase
MTRLELRPLGRRAAPDGSDEGSFAVAVPPDLLWLQGHFPGYPLLPGIAQLLPIALGCVHALWPELGQPRQALRLKFKQAIVPGDELEVRLARAGAEVRFSLHRRGEVCTRGVLVFAT